MGMHDRDAGGIALQERPLLFLSTGLRFLHPIKLLASQLLHPNTHSQPILLHHTRTLRNPPTSTTILL